ncbi:helix-turn-helix domain-containing protein, partial [Glutamicibacter protophormiae]|uniref:helix-turn-helix domain-containing protein n=1 Tax=Glutamicibacter protophormiae TaxID=37930 RepID=UPI003BAF677E
MPFEAYSGSWGLSDRSSVPCRGAVGPSMARVTGMNESRIAEIRRSKGWTQERLAAQSSVTVRTIQRLEAGQDASMDTLSRIAAALQVP